MFFGCTGTRVPTLRVLFDLFLARLFLFHLDCLFVFVGLSWVVFFFFTLLIFEGKVIPTWNNISVS